MRNLLLNPDALFGFKSLQNTFCNFRYIEGDIEIKITNKSVAFGILQPDRYDKSINCYIEIVPYKINFLFEDVAYALSSEPDESGIKNDGSKNQVAKNDAAVMKFVEFCMTNKNVSKFGRHHGF